MTIQTQDQTPDRAPESPDRAAGRNPENPARDQGPTPELEAENRALREALANAEERAGALGMAEMLMGREIIVDDEDPDEARWRRVARAVLEKWHGEPYEQENAVVELLFRERQRGRSAAEDAVQDVLTEEAVRRAIDGTVENGAPMDVPRLRVRVMKRYFEHHSAGRDLEGKPRA